MGAQAAIKENNYSNIINMEEIRKKKLQNCADFKKNSEAQNEVEEQKQKPQNEPKYKKDGTLKNIKCNKKAGEKSEVMPFELDDIKKVLGYFKTNEMWQHYLIFVFGINMGRRVGDTLKFQWEHFFDKQGNLRKKVKPFKEDKTDKYASPWINDVCKEAIELYLRKTNLNPSANNYENHIFIQTSGNYRDRVLTIDGYRKGLKKAAATVGIKYNVGTHSTRKTFGRIICMMHPDDPRCMSILRGMFNHFDEKVTEKYVGITDELMEDYYSSVGNFFNDYVVGDKTYSNTNKTPIIFLEESDLRDIIHKAILSGINLSKDFSAEVLLNTENEIMSEVARLRK